MRKVYIVIQFLHFVCSYTFLNTVAEDHEKNII